MDADVGCVCLVIGIVYKYIFLGIRKIVTEIGLSNGFFIISLLFSCLVVIYIEKKLIFIRPEMCRCGKNYNQALSIGKLLTLKKTTTFSPNFRQKIVSQNFFPPIANR
jgi:hypothetical protein